MADCITNNPRQRTDDQINWLKNIANIKALLAILDKYRLTFLPMPPQRAAEIRRQLELRGLKQLIIPNAAALTGWVLNCKRTLVDGSNKRAQYVYDAIYLNDQQMLESKTTNSYKLVSQQFDGLHFETIDLKNMPLSDRRHYAARLYNGWSITAPKNFDILTYRALLRLPDKIGGVELDAILLKRCFNKITGFDCLNPDSELQPNFESGTYTGNNLQRYGITPFDYVRARYAARLIPDILDYRRFSDANKLHPACWEITNYQDEFAPVYWPEYEKIPENLGLACNQDAYGVLTKINTPRLERAPENKKTGTFDRIRIYMGVKSKKTAPNRSEFIRTHQKDIAAIAINKIAQLKSFQKTGVPVGFLKLTNMTLTSQDELELVFELKQPKI